MLRRVRASSVLALLGLCACSGSHAPSPPVPAASQTSAAEPASVDQPANPAFIGRVWISVTPGSPRGSILVFLPDRTLLMDSCFETFRLSKWGVAGERIRWLEDSVPIEADVIMPRKDELRLRIAGQNREQAYVAASVPYVCPDMPR
jgi:hypothetical protein